MEATRQLRLDQVGKTGLAQIHLTFCWNGQRLRLGSGQRCAPKDWDAKRQRAKKGNAYAETINQVLDDYAAATAAYCLPPSHLGRPAPGPSSAAHPNPGALRRPRSRAHGPGAAARHARALKFF